MWPNNASECVMRSRRNANPQRGFGKTNSHDPNRKRLKLACHAEPDSIPLTLVAAEGNEPVGSVSLVESDLTGWDHLTPWLASLYVRPDWRGQGIGKLLVGHA